MLKFKENDFFKRDEQGTPNLFFHEGDEPFEGNGGLVHLTHKKALEDHRIELAPRPPHQKPIQLIKRANKRIHPFNNSIKCYLEDGVEIRSTTNPIDQN